MDQFDVILCGFCVTARKWNAASVNDAKKKFGASLVLTVLVIEMESLNFHYNICLCPNIPHKCIGVS